MLEKQNEEGIINFTRIKAIVNRTGQAVVVKNREKPNTDRNVPANATKTADITIPWANHAGEFNDGHHLVFNIPAAGKTWVVWQRGDIVRCSSGAFADDADPVIGDSTVDGDRVVTISDKGELIFEKQ